MGLSMRGAKVSSIVFAHASVETVGGPPSKVVTKAEALVSSTEQDLAAEIVTRLTTSELADAIALSDRILKRLEGTLR